MALSHIVRHRFVTGAARHNVTRGRLPTGLPSELSALLWGGSPYVPSIARSVSHLLRALETFKALGIEFVSLSEQMDTSTPTGKMVFTVLGAVAELERSLIAERVRAGLRNARAKGKRLGRPRLVADRAQIARLRAQGSPIREIAAKLGLLPSVCS